jgi:hypothetical protein
MSYPTVHTSNSLQYNYSQNYLGTDKYNYKGTLKTQCLPSTCHEGA